MTPVVIDRLYTLAAVSRSSLFLAGIPLATSLLNALSSAPTKTVYLISSVCGFVLPFMVSVLLMPLGGDKRPGKRPVNIHWSNSPDGLVRTTKVGYINGQWDQAPFKTAAYKSIIPLFFRTPLQVLTVSVYSAVGLLAVALFAPTGQLAALDEMFDSSFGFMSAAGISLVILAAAYLIFMKKYALDKEPLSTGITALIAFSDSSPIFLDPATGRARHCLQMNGHIQGTFRWTQHNSAQGDRY